MVQRSSRTLTYRGAVFFDELIGPITSAEQSSGVTVDSQLDSWISFDAVGAQLTWCSNEVPYTPSPRYCRTASDCPCLPASENKRKALSNCKIP